MKTAIIYARVSSAGQAEKELPIASQVEACQAKAAELGVQVLREFKDEGISGRTSQRPAFLEAIEYCGVLAVDYFILWDTKRFARNHIDAAVFKRELRNGGTELVYVSQDFKSEDGWLLEGMFNLMDESQSRRISRDTRRSMMKNARDGMFNGGRVPFGYQAVAEGKRRRLQVLDAEAWMVRRIFSECLQGAGTKSIALGLNAAGLRRRGRPWTKNTVGNMLCNWVYAGYVTFNRMNHAEGVERPEAEWIRTPSHEPIVAGEDIMKVQRLQAGRAPRESNGSPKSTFLFTGLLKCGACGMGMQIETASGRSRMYSYYNCAGALKGKGCRNRRITADVFDAWLLDRIMDRILTTSRLEEIAREIHELQGNWVKDRQVQRECFVIQLRDVEGRRARLFDLLELHGQDAPNLKDLTYRLRDLNEQIRALEGSLTALEARPAPAAVIDQRQIEELATSVYGMLKSAEPQKLRAFLGSFIERVDLGADGVALHYHPDRLVNARPFDVVHSGGRWLPKGGSLRTAILHVELPQRFRRAA